MAEYTEVISSTIYNIFSAASNRNGSEVIEQSCFAWTYASNPHIKKYNAMDMQVSNIMNVILWLSVEKYTKPSEFESMRVSYAERVSTTKAI